MSINYTKKPLTKPLKGSSPGFGTATFDILNVTQINIDGFFEDGMIVNMDIRNSTINNTPIGIEGPSLGGFSSIIDYGDLTLVAAGGSVYWDSESLEFNINNSDLIVTGCSRFGNLEICDNYIKAANSNGDVEIIPNGVGTVFIRGAITNIASFGNLNSDMNTGSISFTSRDAVSILSRQEGSSYVTHKSQNFTTVNGDISFHTDTGIGTKTISNIVTSNGNVIVTTTTSHNVLIGDTITLSSTSSVPPVNGIYIVGSVISINRFSVATTTEIVSQGTSGLLLKYPNNDINLNASRFVNIPDDIPLIFGNTENSITGSTSGLVIESLKDINVLVPTAGNVYFPIDVKVNFGTSSNFIKSDQNALYMNSNDKIVLSGPSTQIVSSNVSFSDPNITLGDFTSSALDPTDRGIEFKYTNSLGVPKLGWFGYKKEIDSFTFISDATNTSEVISGSQGNMTYAGLSVNQINISSSGTLNMGCGTIVNTSQISGCNGVIDIRGTENVNISSLNRIHLDSKVLIPSGKELLFGTIGTLMASNSGNLGIVTGNLYITSGSLLVNHSRPIGFNGSSTGTVIVSDSQGSLSINSTKDILLNTSASIGNIIIKPNTNLYIGNSSNSVMGDSAGIYIATTVSNSRLTLKSNQELLLSSNIIRIPDPLVFGQTGTVNNLRTTTSGTFIVTGNSTNSFRFQDFTDINVLGQTKLVFGTSGTNYISSISNSNLLITSNTINQSSTTFNSVTDTFNVQTNSTNISSGTFAVTGTLALFNTANTQIIDPVVTIGNNPIVTNDFKDRGIEYLYVPLSNTSASTNAERGWFGYKNSLDAFAFYSKAINTSKVISGTLGNIQVNSLYLSDSIVFGTRSNLNLNCGTLGSVHSIFGCNSLNIIAPSNINISGANTLISSSKLGINYGSVIQFGPLNSTTSNTILCNTSGDLLLNTTKVIIQGDLQVNGTTSNIYSTVTNIQDPIFSLGGVSGPEVSDFKDRGIEFKWYDTSSKTGFFGFKNSNQRFVFIPDGLNTNEVFSGTYGDVQVGDIYAENINLDSGAGVISGVSTLVNDGDVVISPSNGNVIITKSLFVNNSSTSISSSNGQFMFSADSISLNTSDVNLDGARLNLCDDSSMYCDTTGNLFLDSNGVISLNTDLLVPVNHHIQFGSTNNSIISDGDSLRLNGFSNVNMDNLVVSSDITVIGNLNAINFEPRLRKYILPLGSDQRLNITSIENTNTAGILQLTTDSVHYLVPGDTLLLDNTNSIPVIDGSYTVNTIISSTQFSILHSAISTPGNNGILTSTLKVQQGKDVGIQVNYWSTNGTTMFTSGSANALTGFFGFKRDSERWTFYRDATIANDIVTNGNLGSIEVGTLVTNNISGYTLQGPVTAGNNAITGTNFRINGGNVDATPVGSVSASSGRFTLLTNTVSATLVALRLNSTLTYTPERFTTDSGTPTRSPNTSNTISFISVPGVSFTGTGTMPVSGMNDGQLKVLVCSFVGDNCKYELAFPPGKLVSPNPLSQESPSKIVFKRAGQSIQLIWDNTGSFWVPINSGVYIQ